jgi:RHS repeat-associated protein
MKTFTYGPYIDEPVTMAVNQNGQETVYYYLRNSQYSVTSLTDEAGAVAETYLYTAYGEPAVFDGAGTEINNSAIGNPYMYTGRRWDADTGMYNFRNRYYNPEMGRFVSRDPIGYVDGMNLYAGWFVVGGVDPWGLKKTEAVPIGLWWELEKTFERYPVYRHWKPMEEYICKDKRRIKVSYDIYTSIEIQRSKYQLYILYSLNISHRNPLKDIYTILDYYSTLKSLGAVSLGKKTLKAFLISIGVWKIADIAADKVFKDIVFKSLKVKERGEYIRKKRWKIEKIINCMEEDYGCCKGNENGRSCFELSYSLYEYTDTGRPDLKFRKYSDVDYTRPLKLYEVVKPEEEY